MAPDYEPLERRPIASRDLKLSQRAAGFLARRGVSPNAISIAGMLSGIAAGVAFAMTAELSTSPRAAWIAAAVFIQLRLIANLLDGMAAIQSKRASPLGELFNEVPDRVSDAATLIGAGYAIGGHLVLGYAAACVAIFTAYVRAAGKVAGATQEFCGPMAKQQRMFLLTVIALYSGVAPASWQLFSETSDSLGLVGAGLIVIICGGLLTALRRLLRIRAALDGRTP